MIRNKYCNDVVECRIVEPQSQYEKTLDHQNWHANVNVREWYDK